jgi:hypothetical protein
MSKISVWALGRRHLTTPIVVLAMLAASLTPPMVASVAAASPPSAPTGVYVVFMSPGVVTVSWTPPASNGGASIVEYEIASLGTGNAGYTGGTTTAYTFTNLPNGYNTSFEVWAENAYGYWGPGSAASGSVYTYNVPSAPQNVYAYAQNGAATVTWSPPSDSGGYGISYYSVRFPNGNQVCSTSGTGCTINGLNNGQSYTFIVYAYNQYGPSPASLPSWPVTPGTVPDASPWVWGTTGNGYVDLFWYVPYNNGGAPISYYHVVASNGLTCDTSYTECGFSLTNGQSYTFTVYAINMWGWGPGYTTGSFTPVGPPGAPSMSSLSPGNGSMTVYWNPPADTGGSPITSYTVAVWGMPQGCTTTGNSCTVSGLGNGLFYWFSVTAANSAGTGPNSGWYNAGTGTTPGAPTGVSASAGNGSAFVSWNAPGDGSGYSGGWLIYDYSVTSSPGGNTCWSGGATSCTVYGLTNGQDYTFTVVAYNTFGGGPNSLPSTPVTPSTVPGAPTGVSAVAGLGSATISWSVPVNNGGAPITGYTATALPGGKSCSTSGTSCTVQGLTPGQVYKFTVTATNGTGTGPASDPPASVTPFGPLAHLLLSPANSTIAAGGSQAYTATGFDAEGDFLGDVTTATIFTIDRTGSCTGATCTSIAAVSHTVTGIDGTATGTAMLQVTQATPIITWANPAAITYGTPLDGTQLNARANVPGTFTYTPGRGAVLDAGSGQTLSVQFTPDDTADYASVHATVSLDVLPAPITVTAYAAQTKVYGDADPGFTYTITAGSLLTGDSLSGALDRASGENVGAYAIGQGSLVNANYTITFVPNDFTITARPITVTAVTDTKVYDGTTDSTGVPTITSGSLAFSDSATWTQTFDSPSVGSAKTLTPAGTVSDGNGGANYEVTFVPDLTASITPLGLTVSGITAADKPYDGTTSATLDTTAAALVGVVGTDDVSLDTAAAGVFADANVGTAKTVTVSGLSLGGADAPNYALTQPTTTASITRLPISGSFTASDKVYDGGTSATIATRSLSGVLGGDSVTLTGGTASFADANVGTAKTVTGSGFSLSGAQAGNYSLGSVGTTTASITKADASVTPDPASKVYGSADPALSGTLTGFLPADGVTATYTRTAGETIAGSPYTISATLAPAGVLANYSITYNTAAFTITAGPLDHLVLSPSTTSVNPGVGQTYTATGYDASNNSLGDVTSATTFAIADGTCTGTSCTSTIVGDHSVTGTDGTATGTAVLHVNPGALDHLVISPSGVTISAGASQAYTAEGYDSSGNDLGSVTSATVFTIDSGTACPSHSCSSTVAGDHTITGTDGSATGSAVLHVNPGSLDHLAISPSSATVDPGVGQAYTATGLDAANNSLGDVTSATVFTIADGSCTGSSCTSTVAGDHTVTGTDGSATGTATLEVTGVLGVVSGATYHSVGPVRILDSRSSLGDTTLVSRTKQTLNVTGSSAGVPAGAVAVTGNLTIVGQTALGYVSLAPSLTSGTQPGTSTINFPVGDIRANGVTVPLSDAGTIDVMFWASSTTDTVNVLFDVTGYFANDTTGATYHSVGPVRILDSRSSLGDTTLVSRTKQTLNVTGSSAGVPAGAIAVTGNLTVVGQSALGYVSLAPSLTTGTQPGTSTINFPVGDIRANGVTVPLSDSGTIDVMFWASSTTDTVNVLFDVTGYFSAS